jgi:hypothetical protein
VQTGFAAIRGDVLVIQDADLEYDPNDWEQMYDLIATRRVADVVFGSRFYGRPHRSLYFHHYLGNRLISVLFNIMFDQTLTDIEACYKMMTSAVARSLRLTTNDFGIEVEVSAADSPAAKSSHLRSRHQLFRKDICRGQEDRMEGWGQSVVVSPKVSLRMIDVRRKVILP